MILSGAKGEGSRLGDDSMSSPARPNARPWMAGPGVGYKATVSPGMAGNPLQKNRARFFFCDRWAQTPGAAFFGYFLSLLTKSNSPVGENPNLHLGKAGPLPCDLSISDSVIPAKAGIQCPTQVAPHSESAMDSRFRGNDEWKVETERQPLDMTLRVNSGRTGVFLLTGASCSFAASYRCDSR